jgi:hypothetical protein
MTIRLLYVCWWFMNFVVIPKMIICDLLKVNWTNLINKKRATSWIEYISLVDNDKNQI